jgi:hypothetical protein
MQVHATNAAGHGTIETEPARRDGLAGLIAGEVASEAGACLEIGPQPWIDGRT